MNSLHSALIHLPLGLLLVYSLVELGLVFFPKYLEKLSAGKYLMLVLGVLGAFMAFSTGDGLAETRRFNNALVELHATFAGATIWVYAILAGSFTLQFLVKWPKIVALTKNNLLSQKVIKLLSTLVSLIVSQPVLIVFSILGAILLTVTGALGGALAHGPNADFITAFIYSLFF